MPLNRPDMNDLPSNGAPEARPKTLVQQLSDFTAEGAPAPRRGAEAAASAASAAEPLTRTPDSPVSTEDWDMLLDAIMARLRHAVDEALTAQYNGAAAPLRVSVLECIDALEHLRAMRVDGRTRPTKND